MLTVFFRSGKTRKKVHVFATVNMLISVGLNLLVPLSALAASADVDQSLQSQGTIKPVESAKERSVEAALPAPIEQPILGSSVLTITKSVVNSSNAGPYAVTINGPDGYLQNTTVLSTTPTVLTGLANGIYTVTETSPGAGWTTTYTATTGYSTGSSGVVTLTSASSVLPFSVAQITGTVYTDYNSDGMMSANGIVTDTGNADVRVVAYAQDGTELSPVTTDASGRYTITTGGVAGPFRLEFSNLPSGYEPSRVFTGTQNGTTVQFINSSAEASNVNLGIAESTYFSSSNPQMAVAVMSTGAYTEVATVAIRGLNYDGSSQFLYNLRLKVGTVWGLAWDPETKNLFSSAFLRRFADFGPNGMGAIYATNRSSGVSSTSLVVDLAQVGSGVGVIAPRSWVSPTRDVDAFENIGEVGLGDIDLDTTHDLLYVVNLFAKSVQVVNLTSYLETGTAVGSESVSQLPAYPAPNCVNGQDRPFALKFKTDKVYLGVICDASDAVGSPADLNARVYVYDLNLGVWSVAVAPFALDYDRDSVYSGNPTFLANFQPWTDSFVLSEWHLTYGQYIWHPQPMLSDIEFDNNGDMILSFADRGAYQMGASNFSPNSDDTALYRVMSGGELLRAAKTSGTAWVLESNGTTAHAGGCRAYNTSSSGTAS